MSHKQKCIFIVDDETIITRPLARLIRGMLKTHDLSQQFEWMTQNDPTIALEEIEKLYQDGAELALVITDIMMPQMGGMDFLAEVIKKYPNVVRIVLTGYADKKTAVRALNELDVFQYIEKPWVNDQFQQIIYRALNTYKTEDMFGRYVPREIIDEYLAKNDEALLVGKNLEATIMFLDIVDFTKEAENMKAIEVVNLLNSYFSMMVDIIHEFGGILDKYTGDGLMALFGVPHSHNSSTSDAQNAVHAAVKIVQEMNKLNSSPSKKHHTRIRIGLNTGQVVAGNIGSASRINYTVVGDTVNTASRIEDVARKYIQDELACVLLGEATYEQIKPNLGKELSFESFGPISLRGKDNKVKVYKVNF